MKVAFVVPGPPQAWQRVSTSRVGVSFVPTETRRYQRHVADCALAALSRWTSWRIDWASYRLTVRVYRAAERGDVSNYLKTIEDALNRIAYEDDRAIESTVATMTTDRDRPRVEVEIEMLGDETREERRARLTRENAKRRRAVGAR